jgi:hypothetical protein
VVDKNVKFIDLDPVVWNRLGEIEAICVPPRVSLHILHDKGVILKAFHSAEGEPKGIWMDFAHKKECIQHILDEYPDVNELYVYDWSILIDYYKRINTVDCRHMDVDEFNSLSRSMMRSTPGIDVFARDGQDGDFMGRLRGYAARCLPQDCVLLLALFNNGTLYFDVVLGFTCGKLDLVTTFEHFIELWDGHGIAIGAEKPVASVIERVMGKPVVAHFMELDEFKRREATFNS